MKGLTESEATQALQSAIESEISVARLALKLISIQRQKTTRIMQFRYYKRRIVIRAACPSSKEMHDGQDDPRFQIVAHEVLCAVAFQAIRRRKS